MLSTAKDHQIEVDIGNGGNSAESQGIYYICHIYIGPDHVQVNWKHKSIGKISQLETRPLIG